MVAFDADPPTGVDIAVGVSDAAYSNGSAIIGHHAAINTQASGQRHPRRRVWLTRIGALTAVHPTDNKGNTFTQPLR